MRAFHMLLVYISLGLFILNAIQGHIWLMLLTLSAIVLNKIEAEKWEKSETK